jgi:hypothetical protein
MNKAFANIGLSLDGYMTPQEMVIENGALARIRGLAESPCPW